MISLAQVRALEDRVEKAVAYITSLRGEGVELARRLAEAQSFIDEAANELAAAEEKTQAAEHRAEAAEELRQAEASALGGRIREFESRLADMAERVAAAEARAAELGTRSEEYRKDQAKIEEGIIHALEKLDSFEDLVLGKPSAPGKRLAAVKEPKSEGPIAEAAPENSGIAVKSASDVDAEKVENELDIF
jgi:DNA repair exonuclease SbcCD ATPase subunit